MDPKEKLRVLSAFLIGMYPSASVEAQSGLATDTNTLNEYKTALELDPELDIRIRAFFDLSRQLRDERLALAKFVMDRGVGPTRFSLLEVN